MIRKKKSTKRIQKKSISPITRLPEIHIGKIKLFTKAFFWFTTGIVLGSILIISFLYFFFQFSFKDKIYPGILIDNVNFGGKTQADAESFFDNKNQTIQQTIFTFSNDQNSATVSAKQLHIGYNATLLARQAYSLGRTKDTFSNMSILAQAYINGINLPASLDYDPGTLRKALSSISDQLYKKPVDAEFEFVNGRVTTFQLPADGQEVDMQKIQNAMQEQIGRIKSGDTQQQVTIDIPIHVLKPAVTSQQVDTMGIKELIGSGTSLFEGSIDSRIYNVELGAKRLNGVIIKPDEVFSFDQAIGDVSSLTGYKQAYVISGGHTVLGDGGGICQVSTTFFRAALNSGLPIVERHGHDYRVHYYEEDGPPGIDATIYTPTVDLKVKNNTGHAILVQALVDPSTLRLTINMYGTSDGRTVSMSTPVVSNPIPAPPTLYQDDPTLPVGQMKQVDFSADGATTRFSRTVTKDGKVMINDTYTTVYRPWQAVYMRGTKQT